MFDVDTNVISSEFIKQNAKNLDSLTKVLVRGKILEYVNYLMDKKVPFTMAILDVDNFKLVNDCYGHLFGDEVLRQLAFNIQDAVGDKGLIGRYGGDEFIIIYHNLTGFAETKKEFQHLTSKVNDTYLVRNEKIEVTVTIGSVCYPNDATSFDGLFVKADKAMYRGKSKGRNCYIIYNDELHKNIVVYESPAESLSKKIDDIYEIVYKNIEPLDALNKIFKYLLDNFSIQGYYVKDYKIHTDEKQAYELDFRVLDELLVNNHIMAINNYSSLKQDFFDLHFYASKQGWKSFVVVKLLKGSTLRNDYLIFVDKHIKRVWQEEDKVLFVYITKLLALVQR